MKKYGFTREYALLNGYFEEETAKFQGKTAYLYGDMESGRIHFGRYMEERVVSASTIKVPIMMGVFRQIKEGKLKPDMAIMVADRSILPDSMVFEYGPRKATLYELVVWMIVNSDNTATNVLIAVLGMDWLNGFFQELGLRQTRVERQMLDYDAIQEGRNNWISPMDFYHCMRLLKEESKEDGKISALDIMKRNRDFECLCRYLYEGPVVAHKTGELDDIVHDAGMIITETGSYFLGVFVSEFEPKPEMEREAQKLIGRLSRKVYELETSTGTIRF